MPTTCRTRFLGFHFSDRTYTLARYLHQSKFGQRQHLMLGRIVFHAGAHTLVHLLLVLCRTHIYQVDDDDTSHITQTHLTSNFIYRCHIYFKGIFFLHIARFIACTTVYIDYMQCLGMFDYQISPLFKRDNASKRRFYLFGKVVYIKNRQLIVVILHNRGTRWFNQAYIRFNSFVHLFVVYNNLVIIRIKMIA